MDLTLDFSHFRTKARQMGIFADDQLPYAISRSLNDTMFKDVRPQIIGPTWTAAFTVRNTGLPRKAMRVETSTKAKLSAGVFDALGKADLQKHAVGGTKMPTRKVLDIPVRSKVALGARGKKPWASKVIKSTPKRALRITSKGIFVGEGGRLNLVYSFRNSARLKKRFPFYEDFRTASRRGLDRYFPGHIQSAIATAFGR